MRKPGLRDAWLAMKLYELRQDGGLAQAREVLGGLVSQSFDEIREVLDYAQPKHPCLRQAVEYWEMAAAFVLRSLFHPDVYLDTCDEALFTYAVFQEHLPQDPRDAAQLLREDGGRDPGAPAREGAAPGGPHPDLPGPGGTVRRLIPAVPRRAREDGHGDPETPKGVLRAASFRT